MIKKPMFVHYRRLELGGVSGVRFGTTTASFIRDATKGGVTLS